MVGGCNISIYRPHLDEYLAMIQQYYTQKSVLHPETKELNP
jgi:hypothetical protein